MRLVASLLTCLNKRPSGSLVPPMLALPTDEGACFTFWWGKPMTKSITQKLNVIIALGNALSLLMDWHTIEHFARWDDNQNASDEWQERVVGLPLNRKRQKRTDDYEYAQGRRMSTSLNVSVQYTNLSGEGMGPALQDDAKRSTFYPSRITLLSENVHSHGLKEGKATSSESKKVWGIWPSMWVKKCPAWKMSCVKGELKFGRVKADPESLPALKIFGP
ncbi:hypothetical protein BKA70DRAFT_1501943 [Coprinopsis sp. MPI-PUGE-AT-0042]|nr:hypothetical protein BKA70DRAFT_1501943 [Coprinopsis sp. MPI-PUGE-AT-0042]